MISVSYENLEDYLQVIVSALDMGRRPSHEDSERTIHLSGLLRLVLPQVTMEQISANAMLFKRFRADCHVKRRLLKSAKELRLCLPYVKQWSAL